MGAGRPRCQGKRGATWAFVRVTNARLGDRGIAGWRCGGPVRGPVPGKMRWAPTGDVCPHGVDIFMGRVPPVSYTKHTVQLRLRCAATRGVKILAHVSGAGNNLGFSGTPRGVRAGTIGC